MEKKTTIETNECIDDIIEYLNNQPYLRDNAKVTVKNCGEEYNFIHIGSCWEKI